MDNNYDHDPRSPSYIAAETPLLSTAGDFWQMVWEQFAVVIVCLEPESALTQVIEDPFNITGQGENDTISQARYWPPEGCMVFGRFENQVLNKQKLRMLQINTFLIAQSIIWLKRDK
ncbi:hypothetical protein ACTXT7_001552 [Hymenolepis weldensis]